MARGGPDYLSATLRPAYRPMSGLGLARRLTLAIAAFTAACGAPVVDNALVNAVVEAAQRQTGTIVPITDEALIGTNSLEDFARIQLEKGMFKHDRELCQGLMKVRSLDQVRTFAGSQESGDVISEVRVCAAQRDNPKRVAVVGILVNRYKPEPSDVAATGVIKL
jgi:hypothetical protein